METITAIKLYGLLAQKLGNETAENITTFIESTIHDKVEIATKEVATKDFVRAEIQTVKTEIQAVRTEIQENKTEVQAVRTEIQESKADTIKWVVGSFITIAIMIIGLYFSLKK